MALNTGQSTYPEAHSDTTVSETAIVNAQNITHAQPAPSAAQKVFDVAELLERILFESAAMSPSLPCTQLFVWQRVNWTFYNNIQRSKQLRQFMLLERVDDWIMDCIRNEEYENDWMHEFSKYNSVRKANHMLLDTLFPLRRFETKSREEPYTFHKSEGPINGSQVTVASLLQILVESNTLSNIEAFIRPSIAAGLSQSITYLEPLFARQARVQTNQSWRGMKLCPVEEDTTMRNYDRKQAVRDWQRKKLEADLFRIKNPGLFQNWPVWKQDMWAFMR